jgi:hypothetical protein
MSDLAAKANLASAGLLPLSAFDDQVGGNHYKDFAIQPLEFIVKNNLDFPQGCVVKYVVRYKLKNGLEDLKKARHYIDLLIELEEEKNAAQEVRDYSGSTDSPS